MVALMNMWNDRAMPVLLAIREGQEDRGVVENDGPHVNYLAAKTGLDEFIVGRTLDDLWADGLITGNRFDMAEADSYIYLSIRLTPDGLRAVSEWPSGEGSYDALIEVLTQMAEAQPDVETRSTLRRALAHLKGVPRDVAVDLGAAYLARVSGVG
jgi:hypothetical protein